MMADEPLPKRARQACDNCRRKKTRCPGEKPACSFCIRLGQPCEYATGAPPMKKLARHADTSSLSSRQPETDLAHRVAFLETQLGIATQNALSPTLGYSSGSSESLLNEMSTQASNMRRGFSYSMPTDTQSSSRAQVQLSPESKFNSGPPMSVLESLTDVYFTYCHNQPYCYFIESKFRERLQEGALPRYVLLAFAATAVRYSSHPYFEGQTREAMETYARGAWNIILHQVFSSEQGLDIYVVQATNLLAIVDFTGGQHRLGWVKIGLAVRFAQGMRLNAEPDQMMPPWQQEEYRRVFWSVYLLDRFVSCSHGRAPTILDRDCTVRLPCSDEQFLSQPSEQTPTISVLKDLPDMGRCMNLGDFSLMIMMSSVLARVVRYSLQQNASNSFPPWDFRSDFAEIKFILYSFEGLLGTGNDVLTETLHSRFHNGSRYDTQKVAHYIWCRALYYLCDCLLHHPFTLYNDFKHYRKTVPPSFARHALESCLDDAEQLTIILNTVRITQCCARASFLGYFAVVASSIHRLYEFSTDEAIKARSLRSFSSCLQFLDELPQYWSMHTRMAMDLREFDVGESVAKNLIKPSSADDDIESDDLDALWRIVDYGWLTDANRTDSPFRRTPSQLSGIFHWDLIEDLMCSHFSMPLGQSSYREGDDYMHYGTRPDSYLV
ncbi:fungal-specific transcription factor domain-containing protein [Talaromyces proteolyticus]|uniref:Fungal-specific transcription factor domain-containing protein n=1 Tax=Talaromyces proteolyticus TaxID=1131652 RepID=A0AAD4KHI5_9EURO|nr:fungal-specific transcription factor domain-containing protein [Talaromyces proteolyticus]KAH8691352.1 fungal-specific transcription factor domain-containing protein [Talaromyces proteolyticus]